ncbi:Vps62-related protein [Bacillus solimangrovi]|uniref:CBM11 domain-containing protein n=1 Tax=Bacillus solimangrovi TaxID=1305675 RepID=A0A1E5LIB6_9BACI|nr:Vps62-related protein [Bacillus solimangrovi]OEH93829.1 hypothetical protein BFG57_10940 [Bacillus solimangrovi]
MTIAKHKLSIVLLIALLLSISEILPTHAAESDQYLKISSSNRDGDLDSAKAYVQVLEYADYIGLNYRFFYPYNGNIGGAGIFPSGAHAGDWEGVKIVVNKRTNEIESILPSSHESEHDWQNASVFEFENGHPVVYSAEQSHANYWTTGKHTRLNGFGNDYTNKGALWNIPENNFIIFNKQNTPWMDFSGRWGDSGNENNDDCGFSCPNSPKFSIGKGWFRDVTNAQSNSEITNLGNNDVISAYTYAKDFAPRVYLQSNELYFPSTVEWFLKRAQLKEDGKVLLDKGKVNGWSVVGKSPDNISLDITNFNLSNHSDFIPRPEEDRADSFELVAEGNNTVDYVNKTLYFDPDGNSYTFGIWLKAADSSETQTVSLRLRSQGNNNDGNGDNDKIATFDVTNDWEFYSVTQLFDVPADWIRTTIYPAGKENGTGSVLVSNPKLIKE